MRNRGFTLIELIVVAGLISLAAGIVMTSLSDSRMRGRDAQRFADVRQLQNALELYQSEYGSYPADLPEIVPQFISELPEDPTGSGIYNYIYARGYKKTGPKSFRETGISEQYVLALTLESPPPSIGAEQVVDGTGSAGFGVVGLNYLVGTE